MNFEIRNIKIKDLHLWNENARLPDLYFNLEEDELIKYIISNRSFKIKELIDEIIKDFDLPQLEKLIVWNDDENYIVLEGNRRLTGYKLLVNPEIIKKSHKALFNFLIEKKNSITINESFTLECLISEDKTQCFRYIDRKHSNGNNEVNWGEPERINYQQRRGIETQSSILKLGINNYVRNLDIPVSLKNQILGKGFVTTFYRFIATGPAKEIFGLGINENGELTFEDENFPKILKILIFFTLNKKDFDGRRVDTRIYNKVNEIHKFLNSINPNDVNRVDSEIKKKTHENIFGEEEIIINKRAAKRTAKETKQEILFGKILELEKGRVNNLYIAIDKIYQKNKGDDAVLTIIGMSLRLLVEIAAREKFKEDEEFSKDKVYHKFLQIAKKDMPLSQQSKNYLSLTGSWLDNDTNIEGLLGKYAHGNIISTESDILACSKVIGDLLMFYFKKDRKD